jgi:hypothetical protein
MHSVGGRDIGLLWDAVSRKGTAGAQVHYGWDAVNRLVEAPHTSSSSRHHYTYRADGMRVKKDVNGVVEQIYYDGQMPVETFTDVTTGTIR